MNHCISDSSNIIKKNRRLDSKVTANSADDNNKRNRHETICNVNYNIYQNKNPGNNEIVDDKIDIFNSYRIMKYQQ